MAITKNIRKKKRNNTRRKSRGGGPMDDTSSNYEEVLQERISEQEQKLKKLVDEKIKPGSIIYICCLLDDKVIVNLLKYIVEKNTNRDRSSGEKLIVVWLQMNPYNVGVKGGTPWAKYKADFFNLLKRVDGNLTTIDALRAVGIYAVNPVELNNLREIQTMLSQHDIDRPQPNAFGINKLYKLLLKQPGVTQGIITKIVSNNDQPIVSNDDQPIHKLEQNTENITEEIKQLVELFNRIVEQIEKTRSIVEWNKWISDNKIQEKLQEKKTLLESLGGESTYTQILKLESSIKVGPQLSNDWLGMMVASYITTNVGSDAELPEVFNPVFLVDTKPALDNGQTDFMNYLHTNWEQINNNTNNFPDMIIHDGEEDDILTVQFAAKMRSPQKLITVMQTSPSNISDETNFKQIFGNEEMFSFIHIDDSGIPSDMANAKKVKTAIKMCNSSDIWRKNCFAKSVSEQEEEREVANMPKAITETIFKNAIARYTEGGKRKSKKLRKSKKSRR
jgi:hypothetical protein